MHWPAWITSGPGISYKEVPASGNTPAYRIYKIADQYTPPSFNPGDIIISLQNKTIHYIGDKGMQLWGGNSGKNGIWSKRVLFWEGSDVYWAPPSTQSRRNTGELGSWGVDAIVDAIGSPPPPSQKKPKQRKTDSIPLASQPKKLPRIIDQSCSGVELAAPHPHEQNLDYMDVDSVSQISLSTNYSLMGTYRKQFMLIIQV